MRYLAAVCMTLLLAAACSSAPTKPDGDQPPAETEKTLKPSAEKLADCPCGEADWSSPPPGAPADVVKPEDPAEKKAD